MNLDKYDEWKDTNTVEIATYFLDGVMQEFINKTKDLYGMQRAYNFAVKSRALGLGVLGYHSLLQRKGIAFESEEARMLNEEIFKKINTASFSASQTLADLYGEPEWCEGYEVRNLTRLAIAPTVSNSMICGEVSPGVEPWDSNYFVKGSAKGDLIQRNLYLDKLLDSKGLSLTEKEAVWKSILSARGSVQHLECLTTVEKQVYKTAREINQMEIVKQAGTRQKYIDQGQSINLFFDDPTKVDPNYFSKVHFAAYKLGLKSLYYCRSAAKLKSSVTQPADLSIKKSKEFKIQEEEVKDFCRINSEQTGESCSACEG
jgi:ribonucleoside-diphosphate reductase alpha chain